MSSLKYWVWLSSLPSVSAQKVGDILSRFGSPENIFFADAAEFQNFPGLTEENRRDILAHDLTRAEMILEQCEKLDIHILTGQDTLYPERLKNVYSPPLLLYYKGRLPVFDEEAALAVVGSRSATPYGIQAAARLSYGLARAGMLIVSGMARGIDAAAQAAALQAGAPTVTVLGCGADVIYPAENAALYHDIVAAGAVLSEYPPGTRALGAHFPVRNRILSGLCLGTLVVEAPARSGALITARHALDQGRDVFAVPGNIDSTESRGANLLIRDGAALVIEPADILKEYVSLYPQKITVQNQCPQDIVTYPKRVEQSGEQLLVADRKKSHTVTKSSPSAPIDLSKILDGFSGEGQSILVAVAGQPRSADEIASITGLPVSRVLREITMLEVEGAVMVLSGQRYALALEETPS